MFLETLEHVTEKEINLIAYDIIRNRLGNKDYLPPNQSILYNSYDEKKAGEEQINLSQKIVFLKRNILNKLRAYNLTEQEIPTLLEKLKKTEKEFLDELAIEYERQKEIKIKEGKIELNDKG